MKALFSSATMPLLSFTNAYHHLDMIARTAIILCLKACSATVEPVCTVSEIWITKWQT